MLPRRARGRQSRKRSTIRRRGSRRSSSIASLSASTSGKSVRDVPKKKERSRLGTNSTMNARRKKNARRKTKKGGKSAMRHVGSATKRLREKRKRSVELSLRLKESIKESSTLIDIHLFLSVQMASLINIPA